MRSTNWLFIVFTSALMIGCAGRYHSVTPAPAAEAPPNLAALTAACELLQAKGIPVQCSTRFYEGALIMTTHFEEQKALDAYHSALEEHVDLPFCVAAGRSGQPASVLEELHGKRFRVLACATQQWTAWQNVATITRNDTCESVNAARDLPVYCRVDHANGMFTMFIKFLRDADLDNHIRPMLEHVAEPFCRNTLARGDGGLVKLQRAADNAVAVFNCESKTLGPWLNPPAPRPASPAQTTTRQGSGVTPL
jgi:hypothetical protein